MPQEPTKEQIDAFLKDYGELCAKHKLDFVSYPMFIPQENGTWSLVIQPRVQSTANLPVKSPFVTQ